MDSHICCSFPAPRLYKFVPLQAWEVIKCILVAMMNLDDDKKVLTHLFSHPSFTEKEIPPITGSMYKCPDIHARQVQEQALAGMFGESFVQISVYFFNDLVYNKEACYQKHIRPWSYVFLTLCMEKERTNKKGSVHKYPLMFFLPTWW